MNKWPLFHIIFSLVLFLLASYVLLTFASMFLYVEIYDFLDIIRQPEFLFALRFTLLTSFYTLVLVGVVSLPSSYILARKHFIGKTWVDSLLDMPLILPSMVSGVALLIFFGPILGDSLNQLGIEVVFSPLGVTLAQSFIAMPLALRSMKEAFQRVDQRYEKVAATLGFTPFQIFCRVTVPIAKSGIFTGLLLAWARAMGEFGAISILAGLTKMKTETASVAIYLNMSFGELQFALAIAIIMVWISLAILIVFRLLQKEERE